eukprot:10817548-Ditylum_brightwellii.AAC.1
MDNILQALGFGSRVIGEEKAAELQHSTAKEDGNSTNATMAVTDSCGPINNQQQFSVEDGADNSPQDVRMREMGQMVHHLQFCKYGYSVNHPK